MNSTLYTSSRARCPSTFRHEPWFGEGDGQGPFSRTPRSMHVEVTTNVVHVGEFSACQARAVHAAHTQRTWKESDESTPRYRRTSSMQTNSLPDVNFRIVLAIAAVTCLRALPRHQPGKRIRHSAVFKTADCSARGKVYVHIPVRMLRPYG